MKFFIAALVLGLGSALGTAALAAPAATSAADPSNKILVRADFPSSAKYTWGRVPATFTQGFSALGVKAKGAYYSAQLSTSSSKYESVRGTVVTTGSAAQARTLYSAFKRDLRQGSVSVLSFPAHGDEQIALYQSPKLGSKVQLLVRRNAVVWQLDVAGEGLLVLTKAQLLAELKKYAAKQKARVGAA
jgi:hypothetical protein